jgi:hypothetical protein
MNSRRLMSNTASPPQSVTACQDYCKRVAGSLGADLNRSESGWVTSAPSGIGSTGSHRRPMRLRSVRIYRDLRCPRVGYHSFEARHFSGGPR